MIPNIISNPERQVRVDRMKNEMKRQGIEDYGLWPSVHIATKPRRSGINSAHKSLVRWADEEGLPEITILEDDVWFPSENGWKYYLENKPKEPFDLYLGGITRGEIDKNGRTRRYTGQFCVTVHERFYSTFLSVNDDLDIDGAMANLGIFYVCNPMACFCYPGWSENCQATTDLSHLLIGKDIYGFGLMKNHADAIRFSEMANKIAGV